MKGLRSIEFYHMHFISSFLTDKYSFISLFCYPTFQHITFTIQQLNQLLSNAHVAKALLLSYMLTGKKPVISIKKITTRGLANKCVDHCYTILHRRYLFSFLFTVSSQLLPVVLKTKLNLKDANQGITIPFAHYPTLYLRALNINFSILSQLSILSQGNNSSYLRTLLMLYKIPC